MNHTPLPPTQPHRSPLKQRRYLLIAILLLGVAVGLYAFLDPATSPFPRCIIRSATGYRCPGCGLQRAAHALLHGHLTEAFSYNRALLFTIPLLLLYGYAELFPQRTPRLRRILQHPLTLGLLVIAVIGWWIARNLFGW